MQTLSLGLIAIEVVWTLPTLSQLLLSFLLFPIQTFCELLKELIRLLLLLDDVLEVVTDLIQFDQTFIHILFLLGSIPQDRCWQLDILP